MARDRAEGPYVDHARQRPSRHRLARRALCDRGQRLHVGERRDRGQTLGFGHAFECLEGDVTEHGDRVIANRFIAVFARDAGEGRRIHELRHRRAPHARVVIAASDRRELLAVVDRQLFDVRETHRRVGMLVARDRAEAIENCHERDRDPAKDRVIAGLHSSRP